MDAFMLYILGIFGLTAFTSIVTYLLCVACISACDWIAFQYKQSRRQKELCNYYKFLRDTESLEQC